MLMLLEEISHQVVELFLVLKMEIVATVLKVRHPAKDDLGFLLLGSSFLTKRMAICSFYVFTLLRIPGLFDIVV